jgi:hypothetical protein
MLLFRRESDIDAWCAAHQRERGGVVTAERLFALASRWYGGRLDPAWRPRTVAASQALLADAGLTGPFWEL